MLNEPNVIIRKYDEKRVCILPHDGFPKNYALWIEDTAKKYTWKDVKIVQTKDDSKLLGVVCYPQTWVKFIHYLRKDGALYPIGFENDFLTLANQVLSKEEADTMIHKQDLNEIEKKAVTEILERVPTAEINEEEIEKEAEKIIKDNEASRGL